MPETVRSHELSEEEHDRRLAVLRKVDTVREAADVLGIPYSTLCSYARRCYPGYQEDFAYSPGGKRRREPCEICGGPREGDDPQRLRAKRGDGYVLVCSSCKDGRRERILAKNQPDFEVVEGSPLAERFAEIDQGVEDGGRALW